MFLLRVLCSKFGRATRVCSWVGRPGTTLGTAKVQELNSRKHFTYRYARLGANVKVNYYIFVSGTAANDRS